MIRNIELKFGLNVDPNPSVETECKNNVNIWLADLAYDLNEENAIVECWINKEGKARVAFRNISPQLYKRAIEELARFGI